MLGPQKPAVLMVCAHEPMLDPRIRWEAEWAADRFDVTVLGFNRADGSLPRIEQVGGYRIVRLDYRNLGVANYFWRFKDLVPRTVKIAAVVLGVVLSPVLLVLEILVRMFVALLRIGRHATRAEAGNGLWTLRLLVRMLPIRAIAQRVRTQLMPRLWYILAVIRVQFAPAAVLFWDYILNLEKKPDVVHCNDLDTLLLGVLAKKHFGSRAVYDAHEYYPVSDPYASWLDIKVFGLIERFLIRRADAAVTVNPMLAEIMCRAYGLGQVHSVPNAEPWVEGAQRPAADPEHTKALRVAAGRIKFLFQGRFTPGRGIDELIDGWARVNGSKAALFLRGPDNMWRRAAIERAEALGLYGNSVFFPEAISESELVAAAAEADVGIIPYRPLIINDRFSCPNKLSQYLHAGLMILANNLPYVKSVVTEANAGLSYDSSDLSTFAAAVERIVAEPELLRQSRENALRYACERFNWQAHGATLLGLYEEQIPAQERSRLVDIPGGSAAARFAS